MCRSELILEPPCDGSSSRQFQSQLHKQVQEHEHCEKITYELSTNRSAWRVAWVSSYMVWVVADASEASGCNFLLVGLKQNANSFDFV